MGRGGADRLLYGPSSPNLLFAERLSQRAETRLRRLVKEIEENRWGEPLRVWAMSPECPARERLSEAFARFDLTDADGAIKEGAEGMANLEFEQRVLAERRERALESLVGLRGADREDFEIVLDLDQAHLLSERPGPVALAECSRLSADLKGFFVNTVGAKHTASLLGENAAGIRRGEHPALEGLLHQVVRGALFENGSGALTSDPAEETARNLFSQLGIESSHSALIVHSEKNAFRGPLHLRLAPDHARTLCGTRAKRWIGSRRGSFQQSTYSGHHQCQRCAIQAERLQAGEETRTAAEENRNYKVLTDKERGYLVDRTSESWLALVQAEKISDPSRLVTSLQQRCERGSVEGVIRIAAERLAANPELALNIDRWYKESRPGPVAALSDEQRQKRCARLDADDYQELLAEYHLSASLSELCQGLWKRISESEASAPVEVPS